MKLVSVCGLVRASFYAQTYAVFSRCFCLISSVGDDSFGLFPAAIYS